MRLTELRKLSHSPVAVYDYYCTIKLSELGNNYQYPKYYQVKNKETVDIYCISMLEDCIVDDVNYPTPKGVWLSLNNSLPD